MKYTPKEIPEEVNVTKVHPLVNFGYLLGTVIVATLAVYFGVGLAANWLATRISPETEAHIGHYLAPSIQRQFGKPIADDDRLQYLGELLVSLREDTTGIPLTVHLIESNVINAAALAGGHIFVTTGLLKAARSENELAFVLAHELGHVAARDSLKGLARAIPWAFLVTAVNISNGDLLSQSKIVTLTGKLNELHYSRKQESAADLYGLSAAMRRYGHGGHSLDFFKRLVEKHGERDKSQVYEYFSSHPLDHNRIEALQRVAREKGWSLEGDATSLPPGLHCPNFKCANP